MAAFVIDVDPPVLYPRPVPADLSLLQQQHPVRLAGVDEQQDIGMIQLRGDLDLAEKPLGADRGSKLRPQHLEGNRAVVLEIPGEIHHRHPPATEFPLDGVVVGEDLLEVLQEIAFQARCALWLSNGTFYIKYLPEEPSSDSTITVSDLDAETGVEVELTPTEDLVTKMIVSWRISWASETNKLILRHNIKKYGTQQEEFDFYCFNQPDIVLMGQPPSDESRHQTWKN